MNILLVENNKATQPLYLFFDSISKALYTKIYNKFHTFLQYGDVYSSKSLKTLNARIWKYKGTIYKLRIDCSNESARVLFTNSKNGDLIIIHAFLKSTRKTPAKDAAHAIDIYQKLDYLETVLWKI